MTQKQKVLNHMKRLGSISPREAISDYNITRLAARIWELKEDGHMIDKEIKTNPVTKLHYARYYLVEKDEYNA